MRPPSPAVGAPARFTLVALFLIGLLSLTALGAEVTATLSGIVNDSSGAVVSGATVTLINTETNASRTLKTDASGGYLFTLVPIGHYRLTTEQAGFKKSVRDGIALSVNQNAKLEIVLQPGGVKEVVEVQGDVTQVDTVSATLGSVETSRRIVDLPLVERDTFQLGILQAGVLPADENDGSGNPFSVSGQRSESLSFLLNGADNNNFLDNNAVVDPNPDAVAEFKILTNNYDAEYGRTAGGIVNQVIKSGTNSVHGSAFEFLRNDAVNARNYFLTSVTPYKRNTFGATIGGPIVKDKTFFFAAYQGVRRHEGVGVPISQTLSPNERSGDFSDILTGQTASPCPNPTSNDPQFDSGQLFDPTQATQSVLCSDGQTTVQVGTPYKNNQVPLNPVIVNYIQKYVPLPTPGTNTFNSSPVEIVRDDQGVLRIDHRFSEKDNIYFSYVIDDLAQNIPIGIGGNVPVGSGYNEAIRTQLGEITWLHTFGTNLVNEAIAGANRSARLGSQPHDTTPPSQLGFTNVNPDNPGGTAPPAITLPTGFFSLGPSVYGPTTLHDVTFHAQDSISWTRGRHSLKFGADIRRVRNNFDYDFQNNGAFDFGNYVGTFTGNVLADFVGGFWDNYGQFSKAIYGIRTSSFHFFGQDSWKITPRLTLDFGMRYEYNTPLVDPHNEILGFFPGQQSKRFPDAPTGVLYPGDPGTPNNALAYPDRNNFAPRFGFSWDVTGSAKLVVRGGGGIFYDIEDGALNLQFGGEAPFGFVTNISPASYAGIVPVGTYGPMADPFTPFGQTNPYPSAGKPVGFVTTGPEISFGYVTDPHFRTPYAENFNFGLQYQATQDTMVEAYYVGSLSRKSIVTADVNPPLLANLQNQYNNYGSTYADCARALAGCADPGNPNGSPTGALALDTNHSAGSSSSNQLQVTVDRRFSRGFNLRGAYTFAKTIDEQSGFRYSSSIFTDPYNWAFDRGLANFDVTQRLVISGIWQLPFDRALPNRNGFVKQVAGGWQVAGIAQFQSGTPFTVLSNANSSQTGVGFDRADLIGSKHIFDPRSMHTVDLNLSNCLGASPNVDTHLYTGQFYFDPTAYDCVNVPLFTFGNSGKNAVRGPGMNKFDLSLFKTFKFTESKSLEFRTEFFNAFNHARFYNPDASGTSATFGQLVQAYDPRLIQFALKFYY